MTPNRLERDPELTRAETQAAGLLAVFAGPVVCAYLMDRLGVAFSPFTMAFAAALAGAATLAILSRRASGTLSDPIAFTIIVAGCFGWLMWRARPNFLPLGSGPDLTHHLLLIQFIERHWLLVHDAGVEMYLGEMVQYTPGSHILAALAGAWSGTDGFHAVHGLVAASVALKAGFVFLIALRVMPASVPRLPLAALASIALFVPNAYFLGSFMTDSFFAQVVSELFAVAMWWSLVAWNENPSRDAAALFALSGTAAFLTWPVWVGAPLLALLVVVALRCDIPLQDRVRDLAIASGPVVVIAAMYLTGRLAWIGIVRTGGAILRPSIAVYGWWFLVFSTCGLLLAAATPRARATVIFSAAIALQAFALYAVSRMSGNETPYLALKMFYLGIYPQAVGVVVAFATLWQLAIEATPSRISRLLLNGNVATGLIWVCVGIVAVRSMRPIVAARPAPIVSEPLYRAGTWARDHVPPECVDYLVGNDWTAYWLHLAVLGNPRMSARTGANETYEPVAEIVRWLSPKALPYAIADLPALPRNVREELEIVAPFGSAAVVRKPSVTGCSRVP
jgi:hypothetical protein